MPKVKGHAYREIQNHTSGVQMNDGILFINNYIFSNL
jgi:hypothetical protein